MTSEEILTLHLKYPAVEQSEEFLICYHSTRKYVGTISAVYDIETTERITPESERWFEVILAFDKIHGIFKKFRDMRYLKHDV